MTTADQSVRVTCHTLFSFEIAQSVDLGRAEGLIGASGRHHPPTRRAPPSFEFRPAPLRSPIEPWSLGARWPMSTAEISLYDFGAATVSFTTRYAGPIGGLLEWSMALRGSSVGETARQRLAVLLKTIAPAASRPRLADMIEDYLVFAVDPTDLAATTDAAFEPVLAGLLRGEAEPLSPEEIARALGARASYRPDDLTIIDWDGALVADREPDDIIALLEFANVQLLELRYLDSELDHLVAAAYISLASPGPLGLLPSRNAFRRLGELQTDAAVLFEHVSNDTKLVGDQYLGRVYRMVSERFRLTDWDQAIGRKLQTIDGIYQKLTDRANARRLELLEWVVIALIAAEFALTLLRR